MSAYDAGYPVQSLGCEDLLEKEMETHSSILAWKIPWMEEPLGYSPWGRKELDTTERLHLFIIGDWNAKVESQGIPGVTGIFGLGVQNEAGQRLIEFCQENALVTASTLFKQHKRRLCTGHCFNLVSGNLWRKHWHPTPVLLPGKIPWMEEPGGLQSMGWLRVRHD